MSGYQDLTDEQWGRFKAYLPYGSTGNGVATPITGFSLMLCYGWPVRAGVGAIYPNGSGVLTVSNGVIISGLRQGF